MITGLFAGSVKLVLDVNVTYKLVYISVDSPHFAACLQILPFLPLWRACVSTCSESVILEVRRQESVLFIHRVY